MLWKVKYHPFLLERFDDFFTQFCWGSKSAEGGPYPLADLDQGVQIQGVQIRWDTGMTMGLIEFRNKWI